MEPEARKLTPEEEHDLQIMIKVFKKGTCLASSTTLSKERIKELEWLYDEIVKLDPEKWTLMDRFTTVYKTDVFSDEKPID